MAIGFYEQMNIYATYFRICEERMSSSLCSLRPNNNAYGSRFFAHFHVSVLWFDAGQFSHTFQGHVTHSGSLVRLRQCQCSSPRHVGKFITHWEPTYTHSKTQYNKAISYMGHTIHNDTAVVFGKRTGPIINTLRPRQNGRHFPGDILRCIFLNENVYVLIKISL